ASFPPTRAVLLSRKKISRPKAGLSRGENISMSHGPNGRTWNRFSSWSKKSRPAGTRNRSEGREQHYAISRTKRDADPGRARDAGRRLLRRYWHPVGSATGISDGNAVKVGPHLG